MFSVELFTMAYRPSPELFYFILLVLSIENAALFFVTNSARSQGIHRIYHGPAVARNCQSTIIIHTSTSPKIPK